ncbi:PEP-CTERM sorting domain-containing protein [Microcoleus sp. F10-C6]|uniref:PEP-CTERM sorting domain-containing protein n=1 Tax=unclassified Microcoleus TaxID=2642155 RepID=UPI002FCF7573
MCTPLAKLAIGLSATMATAFYYLAAAPPVSAAIDVCGPGNFSDECVKGQQSTSASSSTSLRDPVPETQVGEPQLPSPEPLPEAQAGEPPLATPEPLPSPTFESPAAPTVDPEPLPSPTFESPPTVDPEPLPSPTLESPATPDPVPELPSAEPPDVFTNPIVPPAPIVSPTPNFPNIYENTSVRTTAIPEPGTVVALLLTGAGIIGFGRKRNKQVGQQR